MVEAELDRLEVSGLAFGRDSTGAKVQARGGLDGERVLVRVEHQGVDGTRYGAVQEVLRPSPDRVEPGCPHYLACGGCDLLQVPLPRQRELKRRSVAAALGLPVQSVLPTVASPRDFGYRALAKLVVGPDGILGSYRPRSHDVQDMQGCRVHAPEAEGIVQAVRAFLQTTQVDLRYLLVRASLHQGQAVVTLVVRSAHAAGVATLTQALSARQDVGRVVQHINGSPGDGLLDPEGPMQTLFDRGPIEERVGPVHQDLEAGAFSQVNPSCAAELYARAVEGAQPQGRAVLDLYAGSGGVGLSLLAAGATRVLAVESVPAATRASVAAAQAQGVQAAFEARTGPVHEVLAGLDPGAFEVLVLNPPRKGAGAQVMQEVLRLGPQRLVYISCNPASLARDVNVLVEGGYRVGDVTPVDLFPHTRHVETVLVATRDGGAGFEKPLQ